ncbi:uncharacterized protein LOC142579958 [Dermacentor variabilis]|uniref:uncharacterized protein LOC142579958 n=1 Tax=Dermacentor variabilis TaxID=34621 RepID=UPI003F5C5971
MEKESEIAPQRRRRAEKLNSSDPEVVAWQLAVERRKNEQKAKRAAETPEQRDERLAKRRRQEAERRARSSQQQQQQGAVDDAKARRLTDYTISLKIGPTQSPPEQNAPAAMRAAKDCVRDQATILLYSFSQPQHMARDRGASSHINFIRNIMATPMVEIRLGCPYNCYGNKIAIDCRMIPSD